jgi:hypothetical protein
MTRNALIFFAAIVTALFLFLWAENQVAPSFQACISQNSTKQSAESPNDYGKIVSVFVKTQSICSLRLIDRHNGFFAAIAAAIVAAFTFTLWRSTDRLWKAGKEALEVTERAFVYLDGFNYELTTALDSKIEPEKLPERYRATPELYITRFAVQPRWRNGGNTPVENMTIRVDWRGPPAHIPPDYVYKDQPEPFFLAPKAVEPSTFIEIPEVQVLVDYGMVPVVWENYLVGDPWVFIWGRADYNDIFKRPHFVEWSYQVRFDRHDGKNLRVSFIQTGGHNRTD